MRRALLLTLTLLGLVLAPAAAAGPRVRALAFRGAASPVLTQLRRQLGPNLQLSPVTARRLRETRRYRLLVLDGDTLSPTALARHRAAIDRYMDGHGWVLALDVRAGHFARALDRLTRLSVRPIKGPGRSSRAFLFRDAVISRVPAAVVLDAARLTPLGAGRLGRSGRREAVADQATRVAGLIRARLLRPGTGLPRQPRVRLTSGGDSPVPPPEALHKIWVFTEASSAVPPPAYWSKYSDPDFRAPTPGRQTVSWTINHQFDAYLDNSADHPQGNFQYVTYDLSGQIAPKTPDEKFQFMDDAFGIGAAHYPAERAWWTGIVGASVTPDAATDGKLTWQANAPSTPNEESTYTSGQSFEIGASVTAEGPSVSASYTVNNEAEHDVPDWSVASETAGNALSWEFSARNGCDVRPDSYTDAGCFNTAAFADGTPYRPNALSLGNLPVAASGRWRTKHLLEPGEGKLGFRLDTPITLADTVCTVWFAGSCKAANPTGYHLQRFTTGPAATNVTLDASDVIPVGVKSVDLSPNPAAGAANQVVTATVTLARPAPVRTTIKVFSDDANATLAIPLGNHVSTDSLTIPQGDSSGTVRLNTNDNDLPKGTSETATITAFYTEPTSVQLRVKGAPARARTARASPTGLPSSGR